jgi:hypothetical protein
MATNTRSEEVSMTRRTLFPRRVSRALVGALGLALVACSGGGGDATGPDQVPPQNPPPGPEQPPPPPPPPQNAGITGTYVLVKINDSKPGQLVTVSNPDGLVIGLYRFDAQTTLKLDPLQTFTLQLRYSDDKSQYGLDDEGEFKGGNPGQDGVLPLTFTSATYGDSFVGAAGNDVVGIKYDFDGDGQLDTIFDFVRVEG